VRRGGAVLLLSGEGHLQRSRQVGQSEHCGLNRHALLDAPGCDPTHAMASVSFRLLAAPRSPRAAALDPPGLHRASSTMAMRARPQDRVASGWTWGRRTASFSCVVKDPSSDVRVIRPQGAEDRRGGRGLTTIGYRITTMSVGFRTDSSRSDRLRKVIRWSLRSGGLTGPRCKPRWSLPDMFGREQSVLVDGDVGDLERATGRRRGSRGGAGALQIRE
jgi:hypothetical protein